MHVVLIHGSRHKKQLQIFAKGISKLGHKTTACVNATSELKESADLIVTYGNIHASVDKPWLHVDSGYLRSGKYFRCSLNCNQAGHYVMNRNHLSDRWSKLNIVLKDWTNNSNGPIIVCPSSKRNFRFLGLNYKKEISLVIKKLESTGRKVILRHKKESDRTRLSNILTDAYAVVTWSSAAAVEAIINGVPAFVLNHSIAAPMSRTNLDFIDRPLRPDREQWCYNLAYQQWTMPEFKRAEPWKYLIGES